MPDAEGNFTDAEMVSALGWDDIPEPVPMASGLAAAPASEPVAVAPIAGAPQAVVPAGPALTPGSPAPPPPTPAPPPFTPPPAPDPMAAARNAELAQLRQQAQIGSINQQAQQYMNTRVAQGWGDAEAREAATQYAQGLYKDYQTQELRTVANEQAKTAKAYELSHQYGAPLDMLRAYDSPGAMEQAAKFYRETTGRVRELEARVNAADKAPVQPFDSNTMSGSSSAQALKMRYATDGNFKPTPEQMARIMGG